MDETTEALSQFEIVPYDPNWPALYEAECCLLRSCLTDLLRNIEHIGSTAVPNLQAKPIIDLMASMEALHEATSATLKLSGVGYRLIQTGMRNRLLFRRTAQPSGQMYHLHIVGTETWNGRKERIMKDYLVSHPADAAAYGLLKEKLALQHPEDSLRYTEAKSEFIQGILDKAYDRLRLPRINAWTD